jgi:GNAT superfamily N-acetyltransferase
MTLTTGEWITATRDDISIILELMREFYAEEGLIYRDDLVSRALAELLSDESLGTVFLMREGSATHGYCVGSFGFSLEFGGRYVLLDELYLCPSARGRGEGKRALAVLEAWAGKRNATATRLEVNHHNQKALGIYLKQGYINDDRRILTKSL